MKEIVSSWLSVIDKSLEKLSNHSEGKTANLPKWALSSREIKVFRVPKRKFNIVSILPNPELDKDIIKEFFVKSDEDLRTAYAPIKTTRTVSTCPAEGYCLFFGDMKCIKEGAPLALPVWEFPGIFIEITDDLVETELSVAKAKHHALDLWNNVACKFDSSGTFIENVRNILLRLSLLIKRKAFLERRIHRFVNEYRVVLLPDFKCCYYEHIITKGNEEKKADFVLDRGGGFPSLLIELENPIHQLFLKDGGTSAPANHARHQIAEWCSFIDQDSRNVAGEFAFLSGPKERLVLIGRGLDRKQEMLDTKFEGTLMWTYDLFIQQAKNRWNRVIREQCRFLQLDPAPQIP